jgi:Fe-Mn family superoxide dismutase
MDKRTFIKTSALAGAGILASRKGHAAGTPLTSLQGLIPDKLVDSNGTYILPPLDYPYDALEPHIDEETLHLHHDKHHAGYVKGLNKASAALKDAVEKNDFALVKHWERELAFHGAGHFLHSIYWKNMSPKKSAPSGTLKKYLSRDFGSMDQFVAYFSAATKKVEGSGWGILAWQPVAGKLVVLQAEKHQNLSQWLSLPLLVCDVWEHAYYLKYRNKRGDYIRNFFEVVNWDDVGNRLDHLLSTK